jgi:FkbM family methyltransferase
MHRIIKPAPFVLLATGHGSMIVNRNDYYAPPEAGGAGFGVGYQLFGFSTFDPEEVDMVLNLLNLRRTYYGDGVVALDCGANIGVHTIEWAQAMTSWGRVVAFEAQERIFYALAGNIALNNVFNASALHAAIGGEVGSMDIPVLDYNAPASYGSFELKRTSGEMIGQVIDYENGPKATINLVTIDHLECERVDLIKIDIEGMEMEALAGAKDTLARSKPVLLIEHVKLPPGTLEPVLEAMGYRCFMTQMNILAVHKDDPTLSHLKQNNP